LPISLSAGDGPASFPVAGLRVSPNICYETVLPHVIRRQVRDLAEQGEEPDVLVNLTNDGWFWGSSELDMHLACGVFRAVECRKPLLIAANTGFSAWIDSDGRIREQGLRRQTDTILATVAAENRSSRYLEYGDWFSGGCLAVCFVLAGIGVGVNISRRRSARQTKPNGF
jgi:apolipoprotein N-acyltransferase